jgi:V/A-type H+-transporting ATPase subunit C
MATLAKETGSRYLEGYVALMVDTANLRCLVRALRMKKSPEFLKGVLFEGGRVSHSGILSVAANGGDRLTELYAPTVLADAALLGGAALSGGGLTGFERACDNALTRYLGEAKYIPFGEAPVIGFLAALESELVNLRILLAGRQAGLGKDVIRERLRESYV